MSVNPNGWTGDDIRFNRNYRAHNKILRGYANVDPADGVVGLFNTDYPHDLSTEQNLWIWSDNANDTSGGSGAEEFVLEGLNGNLETIRVTGPMAGTSGYNIGLDASLVCVNSLEITRTAAGTNQGTAVGTIDVGVSGGDIYRTIDLGIFDGESTDIDYDAHKVVDARGTVYPSSLQVSANGADGPLQYFILEKPNSLPPRVVWSAYGNGEFSHFPIEHVQFKSGSAFNLAAQKLDGSACPVLGTLQYVESRGFVAISPDH